VVGVWVGNSANRPMEELNGADGAAPIFHDIMVRAYSGEFAETLGGVRAQPLAGSFAAPDGVISLDVCRATGGLARPSDSSLTIVVDRNARPAVRCDQLTASEWTELQSALLAVGQDDDAFTEDAVTSILDYANAVEGGIGVPDNAAEATATATGTPEPSPTATSRPQATARPTSTPIPPPTATPMPSPSATPTTPGSSPGGSPGPGMVRVPNVQGLSLAQASAALAERGLEVGDVVYLTQSDLPPGLDITIVEIGEVYFQTPAPGTVVDTGDAVSLAIRDG
jgi:membrane peptidoglycan carboxypeptidase